MIIQIIFCNVFISYSFQLLQIVIMYNIINKNIIRKTIIKPIEVKFTTKSSLFNISPVNIKNNGVVTVIKTKLKTMWELEIQPIY